MEKPSNMAHMLAVHENVQQFHMTIILLIILNVGYNTGSDTKYTEALIQTRKCRFKAVTSYLKTIDQIAKP